MQTEDVSNFAEEDDDNSFVVRYSVQNECYEIISLETEGAHLLFLINDSDQTPAMDIQHVFTPPQYRGKGVAETLAMRAIIICRRRHWKVIPTCSYIRDTFMSRHPELASEFLQ